MHEAELQERRLLHDVASAREIAFTGQFDDESAVLGGLDYGARRTELTDPVADDPRCAVDRVDAVLYGWMRGVQLQGEMNATAEVEPEFDRDPTDVPSGHLAGLGVERAHRHGARKEGDDAGDGQHEDENEA